MSDQNDTADDALHAERVRIVTEAVAQVLDAFAPKGMTAEAVIEGSMKAAAITAIRAGLDLDGAASLFADFADQLRLRPGEPDPCAPTMQ